MAAYNGEKYLPAQLDSIINQTYKDWVLYIRDDGSTDSTVEIIKRYTRFDDRIRLFTDAQKHLGPANSFLSLLKNIDSPLYMFSDQDDVWLDNKIDLSLETYLKSNMDDSIPSIVHTDATMVDANLNTIVDSYWHSVNLNPDKLKSYNFLAQCCYTQGATMLFNKAARDLAFKEKLPVSVIMHDWWLSTRVIKNKGKIITLHEPTLLYRQHSHNVMGFKEGSKLTLAYYLKTFKSRNKENIKLYKALHDDGYGNLIKFILYKVLLLFHMKIKRQYK